MFFFFFVIERANPLLYYFFIVERSDVFLALDLSSPVVREKLKKIAEDPVLWAKAFVVTYDSAKKKDTPWTARWYQAEMLRDMSLKKVYLCGRRTGKSESMVIEALWHVYTHRNFVHMFVTPYENQIRLLFDRMKELINSSPLLKSRMTRCVNNPHRIELDNNSKIIGFTTGASSGSGGASLRGQRCDWISLDEMDGRDGLKKRI